MSIREAIFNIPELVFEQDIFGMSDVDWDKYVGDLNVFIITFPTKEMKMKSAIMSKNPEQIIKCLSDIGETLRNIHASVLADECFRRINSFDKSKPERIEAYVTFLLSSVATLSIDIQMALSPTRSAAISSVPIQNPTDVNRRVSKNVIAVDDDAYCLHLVKSALANVPCKVVPVSSAKEALNILNKVKPHLFILDIDMPGMSGIELATTLKKQGRHEPIIFLTGNATKEYVQKCIEIGAADFIVKPIDPNNVATRVSKFLLP